MKTIKLILFASIVSLYGCMNANPKNDKLLAEATITEIHEESPTIQVALLLDTSNSMDGLIDQARAQLWDIVNELSLAKCHNEAPSLSIALYEYGNDNLSARNSYVRKVLDFTSDLDDVSKSLFSLTTNGGSEYCGTVVKNATGELGWKNKAESLKLIFIAGNEAYSQGNISYVDASQNAKEKGITVNTIYCGNYAHGISSYWQEGAQLTGGDYMAIDHNKATVHVTSPYDDDILKLNRKLNSTYVPYGQEGRQKVAVQREQDDNAISYSEANAVKRAVTKSSHLYKNKSWDLVDAVEEEAVELDELKADKLPEALKGKSKAEIKSYITKKAEERKQLQEQIQQLNTKRKNYVAKASQTSDDESLQSAMLKAIKEQAQSKGFEW